MKLTICWLYGDTMNIYGDRGNVLALAQRARWRGIEAEITTLGVGQELDPDAVDIYFWGGGQDREQIPVSSDIQGEKGTVLRQSLEDGAPMLAVCGGYQLLGTHYHPYGEAQLPGIGFFDAWSEAGPERFIGNVVVDSDRFGSLVGFENHSGLTYLGPSAEALGRVRIGRGNNGQDGKEGCVHKNAVGCYLHGALLPKNPAVTDFLIQAALQRRYDIQELEPLADDLEVIAHAEAIRRAEITR
ncbi:MAG: glutamine amidotransferase [Sphaerobacteraceae bacterium]|nr:MAG: glutamine amidotransferase [Sphaerobacteraceae bacterium]